ncbi:hypothetical protein PYV02_10285 [Leifsonia sp. H3M29-4]|uniref:hypothetical protein n=1 Tax=Salinibacterium metalliresistens TaxID=3031321 RepID=UPI0023DADBDB|nr:hypothetical protein [Salinibacterium metalliresistens]MDF1479469.1 hypothetical protein [Salinibacterium metalliresistens]
MSAAERIVVAVAATLPPLVRARYREEWLADLGYAAEAGVRPSHVVLGAVATATTIDRDDPVVTGLSVGALAARRARWGLAVFGVGAVLLAGLWLAGVFGGALPWLAFAPLVLGALMLVRAAAGAVSWPAPVTALVALVLGPLVVAATGVALLSAAVLIVFLAAGAGVIGAAVLANMRPHPGDRRGIVPVALGFAVVLIGMAAVGLLHIFVWNPLAKLPHLSLDEIYAGLAAAGESASPVMPVMWAITVVASGVALLVATVMPGRRFRDAFSTRRVIGIGLAAVAGAGFSVWVAGFSMGMSLADAFATSGGDTAGTGRALIVIAVAAGIPAVLLALVPGPPASAVAEPRE